MLHTNIAFTAIVKRQGNLCHLVAQVALQSDQYNPNVVMRNEAAQKLKRMGTFGSNQTEVLLHPDLPPKGTVLLVHGIGESPKGMNWLAQEYFKSGLDIVSLALSGHGQEREVLREATSDNWQKELGNAFQEVRAHFAPPFRLSDNILIATACEIPR